MSNIYHINFIFTNQSMSGVLRKLKEQGKIFKEHGIQMVVFNRLIAGCHDDILYIKMECQSRIKVIQYFYEIWIRSFKYRLISNFLSDNPFNLAIVRYGMCDLSILGFLRKHKKKILFEHHSKELKELEEHERFGIFSRLQLMLEKLLPKKCTPYLNNLIAVSPDILKYQEERFSFSEGTGSLLPNSIDQNIIIQKSKLPFVNELKIIFSASKFCNWHGLDLMLNSIDRYTGDIKIHLTLVGQVHSEYMESINALNSRAQIQVKCIGLVNRVDMFDLYDQHHIGIDSLGLGRLGIKDGSTLKSKEYLARGLPFIAASKDSGLQWAENYIFHVSNANKIDFDAVTAWYKLISDKKMANLSFLCEREITWSSAIQKLLKELNINKKPII